MSQVCGLLPIEGLDDNLGTKELIPFKFSVITWPVNAAEKKKFSLKDFLRKCELIHRCLRMSSYLCKNEMISEIYGLSLQRRFLDHVKHLRWRVL